MLKQKVIFRVDGNSAIGLGHVTRCCALADMLKDHFDCYFYIRQTSEEVTKEIEKYCVALYEIDNAIPYEEEAKTWIDILKGDEIVVLDGYNFNTQYQLFVKSKKCKLVCVDDIHAYQFVADVIINHAPSITKNLYYSEPYTQFYLGTEYVLLRKIFLKEASNPKQKSVLNLSSILICFGGADPQNFTMQVVEDVIKIFREKSISVVIGAGYMHLNKLRQSIINYNNVYVHQNLQPEEMLALMRTCGIAITSASTIALEYACVKGNLFLKCIVDNQKEIYGSLIEKKCAYAYENLQKNDTSSNIISNQYKLIDGKSRERILNVFEKL